MSDFDQRLRPFADRLAMQIGDTEFGDDVAHQAARSDHAGARAQHGHDAGDRAVFGGRGDGDDRLAAFGA